jgi:hypothetical protein
MSREVEMAQLIDHVSADASAALHEAVRRLDSTLPTAQNWDTVLRSCRHVDGHRFIRDFLDASPDQEVFTHLSDTYDEKEGCLRLRLAEASGISVRIHIWLPPKPDGQPYMENVHGHRRYMVSSLVAGSYASDEYRHENDTLSFTGRRILSSGTNYLITPDTIHAVANPFTTHCLSLIYRGGSVTDRILIFDRNGDGPVGYSGMRPVADLGKSLKEERMSRTEYLRYRLDRIRAEVRSQTGTPTSALIGIPPFLPALALPAAPEDH